MAPIKPKDKDGYTPESFDLARKTCLYAATKLQAFVDDFVVIGGLVPGLIIKRTETVHHFGTNDADLGLAARILDDERYRTFEEALVAGGFVQDSNENGNLSKRSWKIKGAPNVKLTVDFLIEEIPGDVPPQKSKHLTERLAPTVATGLRCAFREKLKVTLEGTLPDDSIAKRHFYASGPGAFIIMKAHAFRIRHENKDAYDLDFILENWLEGREDLARRIVAHIDDPDAQAAISILTEDFATRDHNGPKAVADFWKTPNNLDLRADVSARVRELLSFVTSIR